MKFVAIVLASVVIIIGGFGLSVIFAFPVMLLWNWMMPEIFHLPRIGFWQAWGLMFLSSLLIKNNVTMTSK